MKKHARWAVCLLILAGCEQGAQAIADAQSSAAAELTVGPAGGTLRTPSGVVIEVPAGAVSAPTRFTVETAAAPSFPRGIRSVGGAFRFGPEGVTFARLVRVTLPVPADEVPRARRGAVLFRRGAPLGEWVAMGSGAQGATTVTAMTQAMSDWTVGIVEAIDDTGCEVVPGSCGGSGGAAAFEGYCSVEVRGVSQTIGLSCSLGDIDPSDRVVAGYSCTCRGGTGRSFARPLAELLPAFVDRRFTELAADTLMLCGWPCTMSTPTDAGTSDLGSADVPRPDGGVTDVPRADAGGSDVPRPDAGVPSGPFVFRADIDGTTIVFDQDAGGYVLSTDPENIMLSGQGGSGPVFFSFNTNRLRDGGIGCSTMSLFLPNEERYFALGGDGNCQVMQTRVARNVGERAEGSFTGRLRMGGIGADGGVRNVERGVYSFVRQM